MDVTTIGVDMALIGGIIALCNTIKGMDKENKYKRLYPLLPLILGAVAAYFKTDPFTWKAFGLSGMIYVGTASYIFQFGKTTLLGK